MVKVFDESARMDSIPKWFPGTRLNFAENLLFTSQPADRSKRSIYSKEPSKIAIVEVREGCSRIRKYTWHDLRRLVGRMANAMRASGVKKGDRVAVVASNSIETLTVFLAVTSLGGIFSSSSTDMGVKGILDRMLQIKPRWIFMDDQAVYNEKTTDLRAKIADVAKGMEAVSEFMGCVTCPRFDEPADVSNVPRTQTLAEFLKKAPNEDLIFERVEFSDPFLVVYSSGTTGIPKAIVHSTGGYLISSMKEGHVHREVGPDSTMLQ